MKITKNIKLKLGDKKNYKQIFDKYYSPLCMFASSFVLDKQVAEDIVQDIFVKLWEKSDDFDSMQAVQSFLYVSVKNKCLNHLEHNKVAERYSLHVQKQTNHDFGINYRIIEEETHRMIYNAIDELPNACRNILLLSLKGLKNHEIAEQLNISVNTVKAQKKIAYKNLKIKLKDIYPLAISFLSVLFQNN